MGIKLNIINNTTCRVLLLLYEYNVVWWLQKALFISSIYQAPNKQVLFNRLSFSLLHCVACEIFDPWPGVRPVPLAVEAWSLKHWTAGEVHNLNTFLILKKCPAEGRSLARRHNQGQRVTWPWHSALSTLKFPQETCSGFWKSRPGMHISPASLWGLWAVGWTRLCLSATHL